MGSASSTSTTAYSAARPATASDRTGDQALGDILIHQRVVLILKLKLCISPVSHMIIGGG